MKSFLGCPLHKLLLRRPEKEGNDKSDRCIKDFFGKYEGRQPLEIPRGRRERIILKRVLKKQLLSA
jgi:hypothetical protein